MESRPKARAEPADVPDGRTLSLTATQHLLAGRLREARAAYRQLLDADPNNAAALHHLGIVEHQLGRSDEGLGLIRRALKFRPHSSQAYSDLAVILVALRRYEEAEEACRVAIMFNPEIAAAHCNLGNILLRRGQHAEAERAFACAIELEADFAAAYAGHAEALGVLGRLEEAAGSCDVAAYHASNLPSVHAAKGFILYKQGRPAEAAAEYQAALRLDPGLALVHLRLGNIFHANGSFEEALHSYERAIAAEPERAEFHCNKGMALHGLGRLHDALEAYSQALALRPDFAEALTRFGMLLHYMGRGDEAISVLRKAVELAPGHGGVWLNLAGALKEQDRLAEAADAYGALLARTETPMPAALFEYCQLRRHLCDWEGLEETERRAIDAIKASGTRIAPFGALAMNSGPEDHLALARLWASGFKAADAQLDGARPPLPSSRARPIRLGYLSTDFYDHATASLVAELFEQHDRSRFELFAYCFSPDDGSEMRRRLVSAFDRFISLRDDSYEDAARRIAGDGIDILVDLKGYTRGARTIVLAQRPAPIQVNYLGYPGTMGAPFIDYIIADPFIAPMEHQRFFDERIVHLPDCYQPNDRRRRTAMTGRTRTDHGLPENGFVFCAFNSVYKITAEMFDIWMRLLKQCPGSVLWLLDVNDIATANLRLEAAARGVDSDRLVFAPKRHIAEHQERYAHGDLFLDNLPVCAHTTASEALWAGLPVLTCAGNVLVGRVAGSLLHACGLPELVTHSLEDYEALALRLANDRALLAALRGRLNANRLTAPLFDIERYTRNLEAAFTHMVRLHESGHSPQPFAVAELQGVKALLHPEALPAAPRRGA